MSSIPQNHFNENDLIDCVQRFFSKHHVGKLLANFYRFLNSVKTNWLRFTSFLTADIVDHDIRDLTNQERKNVFIIDDSFFSRTSCKKTELGSKVFDHTDMYFKKGFRMLTLSWSDGNTLIPGFPIQHRSQPSMKKAWM